MLEKGMAKQFMVVVRDTGRALFSTERGRFRLSPREAAKVAVAETLRGTTVDIIPAPKSGTYAH